MRAGLTAELVFTGRRGPGTQVCPGSARRLSGRRETCNSCQAVPAAAVRTRRRLERGSSLWRVTQSRQLVARLSGSVCTSMRARERAIRRGGLRLRKRRSIGDHTPRPLAVDDGALKRNVSHAIAGERGGRWSRFDARKRQCGASRWSDWLGVTIIKTTTRNVVRTCV